MKTILSLTDFSPIAENAARYGLQLAQCLTADLRLINAVKVPEETPMTASLVWPPFETEPLLKDSLHKLRILTNRLSLKNSKQINENGQRQPHISYNCEIGELTEVINHAATNHDISMIVTGVREAGSFMRAVSGSNSYNIIEHCSLPLMLVPETAKFRSIKTIAFATDLSESDINVICSLASMARVFNAEILLIHVSGGDDHQKVTDFLTVVTNRANYPHIYYRGIEADDIDSGLELVLEHRELEILAMVHRRHSLIDLLFHHSHTHHMANHLALPLMVFPANCKAVVL